MQAYIGGIVPLSTVDWPGNVCMVIFFSGCDYRCPYCHNTDLIDFGDEHIKETKDIKKEIMKNSGFIDAVLFSGGEACLQRQALLVLARFSKKIGLKVGVETNGSRPYSVKSLINEGLIDFAAMDIKAPFEEEIFRKATKSETFFRKTKDVIADMKQTLRILKENDDRIEIEIRTTVVPGIVFRKEDILKIAAEIKDIECRWSLQQFRPEKGTLDPELKARASPSKKFLEDLKEECIKHYPNLRIDIKAS